MNRDYFIEVIDYLLKYGDNHSSIYFFSDYEMHCKSPLSLIRPNLPSHNGELDKILGFLRNMCHCIDYWTKQVYSSAKQAGFESPIMYEIAEMEIEYPERSCEDIEREVLEQYKEYKIRILDEKKLKKLRIKLARRLKGDEVALRLKTSLSDGNLEVEITKTGEHYKLEKEVKSEAFKAFIEYAESHQKQPFSLSDVCTISYDIYDFLGKRFFASKDFSKPFFEIIDGKKRIVIANFSPTYMELEKRGIDYNGIVKSISNIGNDVPNIA